MTAYHVNCDTCGSTYIKADQITLVFDWADNWYQFNHCGQTTRCPATPRVALILAATGAHHIDLRETIEWDRELEELTP